MDDGQKLRRTQAFLLQAQAERDEAQVTLAQTERERADNLARARGAEADLAKAVEGLRRIAEHDWSEPPSEMPDEMARSILSDLEGKGK